MDENNHTIDRTSAEVEGLDDDGKMKRTGNIWTATAHVITSMIGSGVLSLVWSIGQMGWIAGPLTLFLLALCAYYTSTLLTDCYRSPHPVTGTRNYNMMDIAKINLSSRQYYVCGILQYATFVGFAIGFTIAAATSARAIQKTTCLHEHPDGSCLASITSYIAGYGGIQIFLSQIPNFANVLWLSYLATVMFLSYSFIILGLGIGKSATKSSNDYGSVHGVDTYMQNEEMQMWNILVALGNIAFLYSFSKILIEIQDTLRNPPAENKQMKRATLYGLSTVTFFYMMIGVVGYLAFGRNVPGNILTGFESPYWLVNMANICVVIQLVVTYQLYTQPLYQFVEMNVTKRYPKNDFLWKNYNVKLLPRVGCHFNLFRMIWRTCYVIIVTTIAIVLPFFNDITGILGAVGFWPLAIYFPVSMYISQYQIPKWSKLWMALHMLSFVTLLVSLVALLGSVVGTIINVQSVHVFKAT